MDDVALVVAIGRWQEEALAEAYRRHGGAVFSLARRVLVDQGLAEDVTQEIFLRLWDEPQRYDQRRGGLRSYLLIQAHGRAVDRVRQDSARRERELRETRLRATAGQTLDDEVEDLMVADRLRQALSVLSAEERSAIELAYFGGHTYRQVAVLLEEPEGTVKSRIRSGLARLHEALSELGWEMR